MSRQRVHTGAVAVVAALALGACGGSIRPDGHATTTRTASGASDYSDQRSALVWMRQYSTESLLWQTVSISPTGSGELTTLIGEIAGAKRTSFKLPASGMASLRRLLAAARGVKPPATHVLTAELYSLHVAHLPSEAIQGPAPPQLRRLIVFLSALMTNYCC
jgi:hypothetical protein